MSSLVCWVLAVAFFSYILMLFWACSRITKSCILRSFPVDSNNHSHGTSSDDHVIINIKEVVGVDPSVLRSIPVVVFNSRDLENDVEIECVVCLSELADGDKARLLPTCNHWFHVDCIDAWLQSNSTCPICRKIVGFVQDQDPRSELSRCSTPEVTQDACSGDPVSCDVIVVVDIPAISEIGESGPITAPT